MKTKILLTWTLVFSVSGWLAANADKSKHDPNTRVEAHGISLNEGVSTNDGVDKTLEPTRLFLGKKITWKDLGKVPEDTRIRRVSYMTEAKKWIKKNDGGYKLVSIPLDVKTEKFIKGDFLLVRDTASPVKKYTLTNVVGKTDDYYYQPLLITTTKAHGEKDKKDKGYKMVEEIWKGNIVKMNKQNISPTEGGWFQLKGTPKEVLFRPFKNDVNVVIGKMSHSWEEGYREEFWIKDEKNKLTVVQLYSGDYMKARSNTGIKYDKTYTNARELEEAIQNILQCPIRVDKFKLHIFEDWKRVDSHTIGAGNPEKILSKCLRLGGYQEWTVQDLSGRTK